MRAFLILASLTVLVTAEPPTSYSLRSSSSDLNFQPVPSVAQIHIAPSASPRSFNVASPSSPSHSHPQHHGVVTASPTSHFARYAVPPPSVSSSSSPSHGTHQPATAYSSQQPVYAAPSPSESSTSSQYSLPQQQQQQTVAYATPQAQYASPQSFSYPQIQIQPQYSAPSSGQLQSPSQQQSQYSLPSQQQYSAPANVQVSYGAPPQLPAGHSYGPPPMITGGGLDNVEFRVVYKPVKGPKPDLVLPPPPPKQKTIVYILIPRVEAPEPIIVPTHPPTPPSKPEVYFIRYKAKKKASSSAAPSSEYGAPFGSASGPKPVVVEAPNRKRSTDAVTATTTAKTTSKPPTTTTSTTDSSTYPTVAYGERVRKLH